MKPVPEHAKQILTTADEQLRRLIAEAATAGDLAGVDFARELAGRVRQIIHSFNTTNSKTSQSSESHPATPPQVSRSRTSAKGKRRRMKSYPRYSSRGGALYRLGWSKKQREEYEHKAPKSVFDYTVEALVKLGRSGLGPFAAETVINEVNRPPKNATPSYQIYVVIGFLREARCIQQVGRAGYQAPPDLAQKAGTAWKQLAESKSQAGS